MECPFCKTKPNYLILRQLYSCENHKQTLVEYVEIDSLTYSNNCYIRLSKAEYMIYLSKNNMLIYQNNILVLKAPIDPSLTPENFEKKLKTYLTFL